MYIKNADARALMASPEYAKVFEELDFEGVSDKEQLVQAKNMIKCQIKGHEWEYWGEDTYYCEKCHTTSSY